MTKTYKFSCGCEFPIIKRKDGSEGIGWEHKFDEINHECQATWDLLSSGNTVCVFQLEQKLGQDWARILKPTCMDELSALLTIIRPGCLGAEYDGKNVAKHYCDKKNGKEAASCRYPGTEEILKNEYYECLYQESIMRLARKLAGFDASEANELRGVIGKKKLEKLREMREKFLDGCKKTGTINEEQANELFDMFEASGRYIFNKSHGMEYAENAYMSAYVKTHFPRVTYISFLKQASKIDRIRTLLQDARANKVTVNPPSFKHRNSDFAIKDMEIYYGLGSIKGIGKTRLADLLNKTKGLEFETWNELLLQHGGKFTKSTIVPLIQAGALDYLGADRAYMLHEWTTWSGLTKREQGLITDKPDLETALVFLIDSTDLKINTKSRERIENLLYLLQNPATQLTDSIFAKANAETKLLGVALSVSKLDRFREDNNGIISIEEYLTNKQSCAILCYIVRCNSFPCKRGKSKGEDMAIVTIGDDTAVTEAVIFADTYKQFGHLLFEDAEVVLSCTFKRNKLKDNSVRDSLIINHVAVAK